MKLTRIFLALMLLASVASADVGEKVWGTSGGDVLLWRSDFRASATMTTYSTSTCLRMDSQFYISTLTTCANTTGDQYLSWSRDVVITRIASVVQVNLNEPVMSCDIRLTDDAGVSELTGSELTVPANSVDTAAGNVSAVDTNLAVTAGTLLNVQIQDGSACSGTCDCGAGQLETTYEIYGRFTS